MALPSEQDLLAYPRPKQEKVSRRPVSFFLSFRSAEHESLVQKNPLTISMLHFLKGHGELIDLRFSGGSLETGAFLLLGKKNTQVLNSSRPRTGPRPLGPR